MMEEKKLQNIKESKQSLLHSSTLRVCELMDRNELLIDFLPYLLRRLSLRSFLVGHLEFCPYA